MTFEIIAGLFILFVIFYNLWEWGKKEESRIDYEESEREWLKTGQYLEIEKKKHNIKKTKNKILPDFLKKMEKVDLWYKSVQLRAEKEGELIRMMRMGFNREFLEIKFYKQLTKQNKLNYLSKFENGEIDDLKLIIEKLSYIKKELGSLNTKNLVFEDPPKKYGLNISQSLDRKDKINRKYYYEFNSVKSSLSGAQQALKQISSNKINSKETTTKLTDNHKHWLGLVDIRVNSLPFDFIKRTYTVDSLGEEHFGEYKTNEFKVPKDKRKEVALSRVEGLLSIRDYIKSNGSKEQKFHLDSSIKGALLYVSSLGINVDKYEI